MRYIYDKMNRIIDNAKMAILISNDFDLFSIKENNNTYGFIMIKL